MYRWELVKGKDRPKDLGRMDFETGPVKSTISLVWRMTKPLWGSGKTVVMDIGLCMFKGLIGMYDIGLYGSAVTKKRRYWPSGIYRNQINAHFKKGNRRS